MTGSFPPASSPPLQIGYVPSRFQFEYAPGCYIEGDILDTRNQLQAIWAEYASEPEHTRLAKFSVDVVDLVRPEHRDKFSSSQAYRLFVSLAQAVKAYEKNFLSSLESVTG